MIGKQVDAFGGRLKRDSGGPNASLLVVLHLGPVIVGNEFSKIARAAVGCSIIYPKDATGLFARTPLEANGDIQLSLIQRMLHLGRFQQRIDFVEEVFQKKG